jgi:hypothetical protein
MSVCMYVCMYVLGPIRCDCSVIRPTSYYLKQLCHMVTRIIYIKNTALDIAKRLYDFLAIKLLCGSIMFILQGI